jgi:hypothetical protein
MEHEQRLAQRRERLEKIIASKKARLLESAEKKRLDDMQKSINEKDKVLSSLAEKVLLLEKELEQIRMDFRRYRARSTKNKI